MQPPSEGQYSPDRRWWWDGAKWVPAQAQPTTPQLLPNPSTSYQQQSAYPAPIYVQGPRSNSYAVASLVIGILSWFLCPIVGGVTAVILGHVARGQIRRTLEGGSGLAMAGLILGYAHLAVFGVFVVFWLLVFGGMAAFIGALGTLPVTSPTP